MVEINSSKKPVGKSSNSSKVESLSSSSLVLHHQDDKIDVPNFLSSYNDKIRPLLDAIDKLRHLNVTAKEGIQLPTIVVVGDQSSGKSSVLEYLAGISLPRGQGICTRVPLIMRLHHHSHPTPELSLQYSSNGSTKTVSTDETHVAASIQTATEEIAGGGKGISNSPLTLIVRKNGVPDLTMVDLPGITRVPVHGQPEDIYEQVTETIMEYIKPEESIILNVLSATVDFSTCESIRMSQKVDRTGDRTLAVVTKVDKSPEGLLEKVISDDVGIGLGYVCVRNRIGDETYEDARLEESMLFNSHPLLSKIDKSIVGVPVLAQKLVQIQAAIISRCLPEIVRKINDKLGMNIQELNKMPNLMSSKGEAVTTFMGILGSSKESLRRVIVRGEFNEYPEDVQMHCTARLAGMLEKFSSELNSAPESDQLLNFLEDEVMILEEAKGIWLPNYLSSVAFLALLQKKIKGISWIPLAFVDNVWNYIEGVVVSVLMQRCESYHRLQHSTRRSCHNLISRMRERSVNWVNEILEMEKLTDYTCNPEYLTEWDKLMALRPQFLTSIQALQNTQQQQVVGIPSFGAVTVGDAVKNSLVVDQAFDLRMRIVTYWRIVRRRLVDSMALHIQLCLRNLVDNELEKEMVNEMMGSGGEIEKVLEESPSVAAKRDKLKGSIQLLRDSKDVLATIMDSSATATYNIMN
ncbi:Dynamin-related protein 4C [Linum grandiflorum]